MYYHYCYYYIIIACYIIRYNYSLCYNCEEGQFLADGLLGEPGEAVRVERELRRAQLRGLA